MMPQNDTIIRGAAFGYNSNGDPDIFYCRFLLSAEDASEDREEGYLLYELIKALAEKEGYEVSMVCSETDPAGSVIQLADWQTVPVHDRELDEIEPRPIHGSVWQDNHSNPARLLVITSVGPGEDPIVDLEQVDGDSTSLFFVEEGAVPWIDGWSTIQPQLGHCLGRNWDEHLYPWDK